MPAGTRTRPISSKRMWQLKGERPRKRPRVKTFSHPLKYMAAFNLLGELQECASHCSAPAPCTDFGCELDGAGGNSTRPSSPPQYNMKSENCCTQQSAICTGRQGSSKPRLLQLLGSFCPEPAIF
ncbi:uncharacterized protein LOC126995959 [Eriocheir sinensis]|uniref:uncharacterized protein LOC126995959 n=1 Tax=Eriocheir sinensis TaxID=95602 RepID=UPI0021C6E5C4|nr:uncharacterized protein LOC126995959 [Eriocheir sinensis]